jgi:hypothetical protein
VARSPGQGKAVVEVEYDADVVGLLVRHGWLGGDEVAEAREVGRDSPRC